MAHTEFKHTPTSTPCYAKCPKCNSVASVFAFFAEPVLTGNGNFVEEWHLQAVAKCPCGWEGSRSVGVFRAKGD